MSPKIRRRFFKLLPKIRLFLVGVLIGLFIIGLFKIVPLTVQFLREFSSIPSILWSVATDRSLSLKSNSGRTNILLLGKAGGNHEGKDLTDTMIFVSINLKEDEVTLLSIPRDIWIDDLKGKINTAYASAEEKRPGGGLVLAKAVVADILDQPVHYAVVMDFDGFKKTIDLLGGVDIDIAQTFDDYKYPIEGKEEDLCGGDPEYQCRFEHLHFEKGQQHMNGEVALKYARSRHAEDDEGTDFARSTRQQNLLLALKNKTFSYEILLNPEKIVNLKKSLGESIETDIPVSDFDDFVKIFPKISATKTKNLVLDWGDPKNGRQGLLINPPVWEHNGAWVLIPRVGNWDEIRSFLKNELASSP
ncbi:LCP family protein [Candidatus Microgenomates bacterium]|nr:LCP family protein [Candidatus Microgenomates bacterium]